MNTIENIRAEIEKCLEALENIKSFQLQILSANEIEARKLTYEQCLGFIDKYAEQEPKVTTTSTDEPMVMQYPQVDGITPTVVSPEEYTKYDMWIGEKQETCDDAISRQAVLDGIEELKQSPWATDKRGNGFEYLITEALDMVAFLCVKQEPSVRPQEQTGHWILLDECANSGYYCSECQKKLVKEGWSETVKKIKYCPNCGCRMVEPQERSRQNETDN